MLKALWAVPAVALLGTAGAIAVYVASPGGEEEATQQVATASPVPDGSATPAASATISASPTPDSTAGQTPAVPDDWQTYHDPVLAFSLRYPPDLVFKDMTRPGAAPGVSERAFEFRAAGDQSRAFAVSGSSNDRALSLDAWAAEYTQCVRKTFKEGTVDGQAALFCNAEPAGVKEYAVVFEQKGKIVYISSLLPTSDFVLLVASLRL